MTSCSLRSGKRWAEKVQSFQKRRTCPENRSVVREESGSDAAPQEGQWHVIPLPVVFQSSRTSRDSDVDDYDGDAVTYVRMDKFLLGARQACIVFVKEKKRKGERDRDDLQKVAFKIA